MKTVPFDLFEKSTSTAARSRRAKRTEFKAKASRKDSKRGSSHDGEPPEDEDSEEEDKEDSEEPKKDKKSSSEEDKDKKGFFKRLERLGLKGLI